MAKKLLLVSVVLAMVALVSSTALALDPLGPPTAGLKAGKLSTSLEYQYSEMDLKLTNLKERESSVEDGVLQYSDLYKYESTKLKNLTQNKVYSNIGYGVADNWEIFLRLGGTDARTSWNELEVGDPESSTYKEGFDGSAAFAWGLGTKVTFYQQDKLDLGALVQIHFTNLDVTTTEKYLGESGLPESDTYDRELDMTEIQIALGPDYKLSETLSIYGGPFFDYVRGHYSYKETERYSETGEGTSVYVYRDNYHGKISEESCFGAYVGLKGDLSENLKVQSEFQFTGDAWAFGASVGWKF